MAVVNRQVPNNLVYLPVSVKKREPAGMEQVQQVNQSSVEHWQQCMNAIAVKRDGQAFQQLYQFYAPKVKSFYYRQGLEQQAEELTHEVFMRVWNKAASYRPEKANVATWLFTIVRNQRIEYLRRLRHHESLDDENSTVPEHDTQESGESLAQVDQERQQLHSLVQLLNTEQRNVLQKVYFEDKSHQLAAEELGMTVGVVKSRVRSALKTLRQHLGGTS